MRKYVVIASRGVVGKNGKKFEYGCVILENYLHPGVAKILLKTQKLKLYIGEMSLNTESEMLVFIFSYNRKEMLHSLISECKNNNCDVVVIDDGSDFIVEHENVVSFPHEGKSMHWRRWNTAMEIASKSNHSVFGFFADDFQNVNFNFEFPESKCVLNLVNDGRLQSWNDVKPIDLGDFYKVGFTDCGFFCQRESIEKIGFFVKPVSEKWTSKKNNSSGVGAQLTKRFLQNGVPIFIPKKSLAFHGQHESKMHPELRKVEPLISK